jgi:hypothetical protein
VLRILYRRGDGSIEQLTTMELDVFAGPNYIVTHREQPCLTG